MLAKLEAITKKYGKCVALDQVTLEIPPGSVVAVLGLNGAGKSTLLRVMGGVAAPDSGHILYDGERFHRERLDLRQRVLFTPEVPMFFPELTVLRNIAAFLHAYEHDNNPHESEVAELMRETDIAELALRQAGKLSRGQIWKLALAVATALRPELWLVDEPFASGMDVVGLAAFRKLARKLADEGGIVIYTTQLAELAVDFADRICLLDRGALRLWDPSASVAERLKAAGGEIATLFRSLREKDS